MGEPAATHARIVSICSSFNERSFLYFWMPTVLSMCQGGICRAATRLLIERAQGLASSNETSDIGAIESGRWQASHLFWKIGAMSLVNVGVCAAAGTPPGGPWLDVGTGTADLAVVVAGQGIRAVGVDIALRWLVVARRRAELAGVDIDLICCNAEHLPFADGTFARVL